MVFQDVLGDPNVDYSDDESEVVGSSLNSSREFNIIESA